MPILCGKLFVAVAVTAVAVSIVLTVGAIMAAVDEADQRMAEDFGEQDTPA